VGTPEREDTPGQTLDERARLLQDTLNSIIRDPNTQFLENTDVALKEAHWAFGVVETGYSASFADNPNVSKPALNEDEDEDKEDPEPLPTVEDESFFVKYIPAKHFVMAGRNTCLINEADWLGYYEWMYIEDVKEAPAYKGKVAGLKATVETEEEAKKEDKSESRVKIWKIWDQRKKMRYVFADGHDRTLLKEKYKNLPLHVLRFENQTDNFYPIPPIYHMLGPQDEFNDSRDTLRKLRKAIVPRYTYDEQAMDPEDLEKFETGDIGVYIPVRNQNQSPINPVNQPTFSESTIQSLTMAANEFNEMAGSSPESRQVAASGTATQANIVNNRQMISESFDRQTVGIWLGSISRGLLQCAIDSMILDHWVTRNSDPFSQFAQQDAQNIANLYRQITFQDLQEADAAMRWDVTIDMESLSPASEQEKRQVWNGAIQMLANGPIARILSTSQELLKRTLDLNGVHSSQEQRLIGEALARVAAQELAMAQQQGKMPSQTGVPGQAAPQPTQQAGVPPQGPPQPPPPQPGA
jgi:hypothetical protein